MKMRGLSLKLVILMPLCIVIITLGVMLAWGYSSIEKKELSHNSDIG